MLSLKSVYKQMTPLMVNHQFITFFNDFSSIYMFKKMPQMEIQSLVILPYAQFYIFPVVSISTFIMVPQSVKVTRSDIDLRLLATLSIHRFMFIHDSKRGVCGTITGIITIKYNFATESLLPSIHSLHKNHTHIQKIYLTLEI